MRRIAPLLLILLILGTAACSHRPTEIQTSRPSGRDLPLPDDEAVFHFVIFGDRTGGPAEGVKVLAQAVEDTNLLDPDLVLTVGDLVEGYNETPQWLAQMEEYRGIMAGLDMPWYPVAGNHDVYWRGSEPPQGHHESNYETHFGPLWYWFGHKNAAFVVLYSDEGDRANNSKDFRTAATTQMSSEQLAWLRDTLMETAGYDHVFVFLHHPRWITRSYPDSNWEEVHGLLADAGNVSAVFAGHIHRQRYDGLRDGIAYYTLATTGGGTPMDLPGSGWLHHLDQVVVRKDRIEVATIPVGAVLDPEEMTPDRLADIDAAHRLRPAAVNPALRLTADGGAEGEVAYRLENRSERPLEVTSDITSSAGDWQIQPDHDHRTLQPGESSELRFALTRLPDDPESAEGEQPLSFPVLSTQVDYLGEGRRLSLPEKRQIVPVRPAPNSQEIDETLSNQALSVDGQGSLVWIAPEAVRPPDGPLTLEAWFKANDLEGFRAIAGNTERSEFNLMLARGEPQFLLHLDGNFSRARGGEDGKVIEGVWHHLAGVFDGEEQRLYLDGRLIDRVAASGTRTMNDMPFLVGAEPNPEGSANFPFDGLIDEVRISSVPRYHGDSFTPARRHEADEDTLLLLHLDGQEPPFVLDAAAGGGHGILVGNAKFVPIDPAELTGNAAGS